MADSERLWYVYILRCADNTLYTGITCDLSRRLKQHNTGKGAKYTRGRGPVKLVFAETCSCRSSASKREYVLKQMTTEQKRQLIAGYTDSHILHGDLNQS